MSKAVSFNRRIPNFSSLCAIVLLLLSLACGGSGSSGGGSGSGPAPPAGDFSISASPTTFVVGIGGSQTVIVSTSSLNGFAGSIAVTVSGVPTGVTANPATFNVTAGNQQQVKITAAASVQPTSAMLTFLATSGNLSHSAQTSLSIVISVTGTHPPIRTHYLRTNLFYTPNDFQYAPPHFTVYDATHKQFFVSNPFLNEIDVFDATQEVETAQIPIPLAWGIDISPSNGSLYAGTLIGDVYQVNTSTLSVTTRYPSASIGPKGFSATTALVLSNGNLALQGANGELGLLGLDGYGVTVIWTPTTNSLDTGTSGSVCNVGNEGAFALSGDRTKILVTTVDEDGSGEPVCSYDTVAQVATYGKFPFADFVRQIIPTQDGTRFFLTSNLNGVGVFDASTVQLLGQITDPNSGPDIPNAASGAVMSLDGTTLYLADQSTGAVGAWSTTAPFAQTGWVPSFTIQDSQSGIVISAVDETGLIAGPIGHGVGFIDSSQAAGTEPTLINSDFATPPTGPLSGGTVLNGFVFGVVTDSAVLNQIYVGNVAGSSATFQKDTAQVTTPPSNQPGAVDLTVLLSDGAVGLAPENFSYGPSILEVVPNGATAEGGQTGTVVGYGFGSSTSAIQVTVGGQPAPVTEVFPVPPIEPYPFPINAVQFTIPPGTAGTAVDVTVTTASGSGTAASAFNYTAAVQSYPITANLQSGIYDSGRNLYYFADKAQIQVLSPSSGQWLTPISLPGTGPNTQLLAISESPDATKLAVSDYGDRSIYVLNPDNPASAQSYPMSLDQDAFSAYIAPSGLAITDAGIVYFDTADISGTGTPLFHKLNITTDSITDLGTLGLDSTSPSDQYDRVLLSPDGTKIYSDVIAEETVSFWLDTSNDDITYSNSLLSEDFPDLAVSQDGSTVDVTGELTDSSLTPETVLAYIDWETWFVLAANGQKLSQDGSVVFSPLTNGIDVLSATTGRLLYRIQIPVTPADVYDVLVVGPGQNTVAVISSNAVSFVDLSSLPISEKHAQRPLGNVNHSNKGIQPNQLIERTTRHSTPNSLIHQPKLRHKDHAIIPTHKTS